MIHGALRARPVFLLCCLFLLLPGCYGDWGEVTYSESGGGWSINISAESVTSTSVVLAVTSTFNCDDVPVFRNGCLYGSTSIRSGTTTRYVDSQVSPGAEYTYRLGGYMFLVGEVWSNAVTVRVP